MRFNKLRLFGGLTLAAIIGAVVVVSVMVGSASATNACPGNLPDHLGFTLGPTAAQTSPSTLSDVQVTVFDACNNATSKATKDVSLTLVQPTDQTFGGGGTLGGTTSLQPTGGIADFITLTVDASGSGYSLVASYPGLANVPSSTFNVYDSFGDCSSGCSTSDGLTKISIGAVSGTGNTGLSLNSNPDATCGNATVVGTSALFTIAPPGGHDTPDIPVTYTIGKRGLQGIGVSNIIVCKTNVDGVLVALSKCPKKGTPSDPCIVSQNSSNAGDAIIKMLISSKDPGGGGFKVH